MPRLRVYKTPATFRHCRPNDRNSTGALPPKQGVQRAAQPLCRGLGCPQLLFKLGWGPSDAIAGRSKRGNHAVCLKLPRDRMEGPA
jgi:hypothetical protein